MKTNRQLVEFYKNKHEIEHVCFSEKTEKDEIKQVDGIVSPLKLDLRQFCTPTDNQGDTAHCVGFTIANILESIYWKNTGQILQFDAAQIYAKAKEIDGLIDEDGTYPEIAFEVGLDLAKKIIDENMYGIKKVYNDSNLIPNLKRIIHKNGFLAGGFKITEKWMDLKRGNSFLSSSGKSLGGHCVTVVGYFDDSLIIQNSWGREWGASGFARISWKVVEKEFVYGVYLDRKV